MMMRTNLMRVAVILLCGMFAACRSERKVVYMQDAADQMVEKTTVYKGIVIQPKDILSVVVASKTPELAIAFNLPLHSYQAGSDSESSSYSQRLLGYLVDSEGYIEFPVLGRLKVTGLTREELSALIQEQLRSGGLLNDAMVNAEFMNFKVSVMGEVRNPGTFELNNDKVTLLEALSRAGDLTVYARRDNVLVRREQEGTVSYYRVDLLSAAFTQSPAFYLQQNDVVYVSINKHGAAQSHINENTSLNIWISVATLLTSFVSIILSVR